MSSFYDDREKKLLCARDRFGLAPFYYQWKNGRFLFASELKSILGDGINWSDRLLFSEHHLSHAASAFYPSPFDRAAILTLDGVGEWTTTSLALGNGKDIKIIKEIKFPHSKVI